MKFNYKKTSIFMVLFLILTTVYSQVGIGTETPKASLDVEASTDATKTDGIIAPRLSGDDLAAKDALYTTDQTGAIVYATAAVGTPTAKTTNVTAEGYYYFDGLMWQSFNSNIENLYTSDGTLLANRVVSFDGNYLYFNSVSATEKIFIGDIPQLHPANYANATKLMVEGHIHFEKDSNYGVGTIFNDNEGEKYGLTQTTYYNGSPGTRIYTSGHEGVLGHITLGKYTSATDYTPWVFINPFGNMGIGTLNPDQRLSVNGNASKIGGGSWATFSDRRVKDNIETFKDGLNVIMNLKPVSFQYNDKSGYTDTDKEFIGFIAQEVEKVAPYMVEIQNRSKIGGFEDQRVFDESALTKILVNAVQEQQKQIEILTKEIADLKSKK